MLFVVGAVVVPKSAVVPDAIIKIAANFVAGPSVRVDGNTVVDGRFVVVEIGFEFAVVTPKTVVTFPEFVFVLE